MEINYKQTPFTWWIDTLDKRFWKPWIRELIILFGYMSSWKTEMSYFTARKNAKLWNKVLYISLELPEYEMKLRICRKKAWVDKYHFQTWKYTDTQKTLIEKSRKELQDQKNIKIDSPEDKTLSSLERIVRQWQDDWYKMFIIDNLDKITMQGTDENTRYQRITTFLQDYKNENDACIILIHHAKKPDSKGISYNRAWLSGMRWSQKIMDNATQVFEIYRDLDPEILDDTERAKVEIIQMKDTFEWANWIEEIFFFKGNYHNEETYKILAEKDRKEKFEKKYESEFKEELW